MTKNYIAALVLLLATALPGSAINPYRRYDTRNGLSDNSVKDICQDSRGYMWFATKDGFNRFNGYRFDVFGSSFSGEHLNIDVICPHSDGIRIWLGCTEALMLFDPRDERLTRFDARNSEGKVAVDIQLICQLGGDCTSAGTESSGNCDNKVFHTRSPVLSVNLTLKTE